jgi:hypothetical protein
MEKCPECIKDIAKDAVTCPHCGRQVSEFFANYLAWEESPIGRQQQIYAYCVGDLRRAQKSLRLLAAGSLAGLFFFVIFLADWSDHFEVIFCGAGFVALWLFTYNARRELRPARVKLLFAATVLANYNCSHWKDRALRYGTQSYFEHYLSTRFDGSQHDRRNLTGLHIARQTCNMTPESLLFEFSWSKRFPKDVAELSRLAFGGNVMPLHPELTAGIQMSESERRAFDHDARFG